MALKFARNIRRKFSRRKPSSTRFIATPPLINPEKRFALYWNAKAGCTFATKWFFHHQGLLDEALEYDPWVHRYRARIYQERPDYLLEVDRLPSSGYFIAKLVRSPFRRAVTSYLHAARHGYVDRQISPHLGREIAAEHTFSFEEFIDFLAESGVSKCDDHYRRQVTPMELSGRISIDKIVKLENSIEGFKEIENELGLPPADLPGLSRSHHHRNYLEDSDYCGDIAYPRDTEVIGTYDRFYNDDSKEKVAEIYAEDFAAYGYDPKTL